MITYAILLTLEDHPDPNTGQHTRHDTLCNDITAAIETHGYENVTIISTDRH